MKNKALLSQTARHLVLMTGALIVLSPFIWMILTSFKPPEEIFTEELHLFPQKMHALENYRAALNEVPLLRYMLNGLIVTAGIYVCQALVAVPCAYALAKMEFPGKGLLFSLVLFGLLIPVQAISIPLFLLLWKLKILNSYGSLILPWTMSVFGVFLMRQFFLTIPNDLIHASRVDGMGEGEILLRVLVPLSVPALTTFAIFSVIAHWNDYFWPLVVLQEKALYTPPLGISFFKTVEAGIDYGPLMAAAVVVISPLILAFLPAQNKFIEGIGMQAGLK
ncbi:MAG: carbohydrate ABC transporter permease [Spirochaetales bacterium]|nr:carbohydrate ABC transporter permease [Spirochaetales bacterium]